MPLSASLFSPRPDHPSSSSRYAATVSALACATAPDCFALLTDFESYPRWSSPVRRCEVMARGRDGLARHVQFEIEVARRRIHYRLAFHYTPPMRASWSMIDGDVRSITGAYQFEETAGGVIVSCTQVIDLGFWIPEIIRRPLEQRALRRSVEEFRIAAETRASGWA